MFKVYPDSIPDGRPGARWLKNDISLECNENWDFCTTSNRLFLHQNNSLSIYASTYADAGIYTCETITLAGQISTTYNNYFPVIETNTASGYAYFQEGIDVVFQCRFQVLSTAVSKTLRYIQYSSTNFCLSLYSTKLTYFTDIAGNPNHIILNNYSLY